MTKRDPQLNIRLPQELKDRLAILAGSNKRSVNAEAVAAIEMAVISGEQSGLYNDNFVSGALKKMLLDGDVTAGKNLIDIIQKTVAEVLNQQQKNKI